MWEEAGSPGGPECFYQPYYNTSGLLTEKTRKRFNGVPEMEMGGESSLKGRRQERRKEGVEGRKQRGS